MRVRLASLFAATALAAGCTLVAPTAGPSAKPSASAGKGPSVVGKSPTTAVKASAQPRKKPPALPERVNLLLPPGLGMVAAGAGNLIGLDGATLIGNDAGSLVAAGAGNLIGNDAGSLVAAGAGNAVKKDAAALRLAQATDCQPVATGKVVFTQLVETNLSVYAMSVLIVNDVLQKVRAAGIEPDAPLTLTRADGSKFTALLRSAEAGGVLLVSEGETFDLTRAFVGMSFESASRGRVVCRPPQLDETWGRIAFVSRFDLATGEASADGASFKQASDVGPAKTRAHWEFRAPRQTAAGGPSFTVHMAANIDFPSYPCESGVRAMSLHFDANGRGAVRMGRVEPGKPDLGFTRNDGLGYVAEPGPDTAFFIGADSQEIEPAKADPAIQALLPGAPDIYRPFPAAPGAGDPLTDPIFAWPE